MEVHARITEATFSAVPEGHEDHDAYAVMVSWRGGDRYAVVRWRRCLNSTGGWDYEPRERDDDWLATHRFGYDEACRLAAEACRQVTVMGRSVADVLAEHLA
jgi:hypothetical protein